MQFSDLLATLRRQWLVVVLGLLITGLLGFVVTRVVPTEYEAKASVLVIPPTSTPNTGGNPYLALGGLQVAADVLARAMSDPSAIEELHAAGDAAEFSVEADHSTSGPMLVVTALDVTPEGALAVLDQVVASAPGMLHQLQSSVDAPPSTHLEVTVITQDSEATPKRQAVLRAVLVVLAGGAVLTAFFAVAIDGRRRPRGGPTSPPASQNGSANAGPPLVVGDEAATARPKRLRHRAHARHG